MVLRTHIGDLTNKQFNKLWKYQATVIFNDNTTTEDDDEYNKKLMSLEGYKNSLNIHQEMVTISKEDINKQNVTLYVPEDKDKFKDFVLLNDRVNW